MAIKLSISTGVIQQKFGDKKTLEMAAAAGFDAVDLDVQCYGKGILPNIYDMPEEEFRAYFTDLKQYADQLGIRFSQTHNLVDAFTPDAAYNRRLALIAKRGIEATAILGTPYTVFHCISTFQWGYGVPDAVMHEQNQKMYEEFIPYAEKHGVNITLESFGRVTVGGVKGFDHFADPVKMLRELEDMPTKNKAFCVDSGHAHAAASGEYPDVAKHIRQFKDYIRILHLHDNNGQSDQHLLPGQGTINWKETFDALKEIGYDGYYNYELSMNPFVDCMEDMILFLGKYLRKFTEKYV